MKSTFERWRQFGWEERRALKGASRHPWLRAAGREPGPAAPGVRAETTLVRCAGMGLVHPAAHRCQLVLLQLLKPSHSFGAKLTAGQSAVRTQQVCGCATALLAPCDVCRVLRGRERIVY